MLTSYVKGDVLILNNISLGAAKSAGDIVVVNGECRIVPADVTADLNSAYYGNLTLPSNTAIYRCTKAVSEGVVFANGANVYYDAANSTFTTVALGNTFFGIATVAAADADAYVYARHCGPDAERPQVDTVAAAGSAQGDAAALTGRVNNVTGADDTKGVVLPSAAVAEGTVTVYSATATNGLKVYPATGDTINGGTANAAVTIEGKTVARFTALDTTNWAAAFTANT